ncbi:MAG: rhodanese-like domain-containing protein [Campylobacterales bacterium]|nr:rhodanese-like domain-containing protein [Campylobacterales bacterium]
MIKLLLALTLWCAALLGEVIHEYPSLELLDSNVTIIDIRTPGEWKETGLLKGAIPVMFFDERGRYNLDGFLKAIAPYVSKEKPFALICHTGSRTRTVSTYLDKNLGYRVINLKGGMVYAKTQKLPILPYRP